MVDMGAFRAVLRYIDEACILDSAAARVTYWLAFTRKVSYEYPGDSMSEAERRTIWGKLRSAAEEMLPPDYDSDDVAARHAISGAMNATRASKDDGVAYKTAVFVAEGAPPLRLRARGGPAESAIAAAAAAAAAAAEYQRPRHRLRQRRAWQRRRRRRVRQRHRVQPGDTHGFDERSEPGETQTPDQAARRGGAGASNVKNLIW